MKVLVVIGMQNDFIDGSLGTPEARLIVPKVTDAVRGFDGKGVFTMDTHTPDCLGTQKGAEPADQASIPGTPGWELPDALKEAASSATFSSTASRRPAARSWRETSLLSTMPNTSTESNSSACARTSASPPTR